MYTDARYAVINGRVVYTQVEGIDNGHYFLPEYQIWVENVYSSLSTALERAMGDIDERITEINREIAVKKAEIKALEQLRHDQEARLTTVAVNKSFDVDH